ncbi:MAG: MarR family transcriptional regulator [Kofleriaceae bacterium]|jgi:DNA-binding MarR family transcriptional regulator|nr:MarR family transcriptional regulator [Kofleriaceae bacterium]MBP6837589.1 MarR family transcriptional regulator [Kofleriaceae bacterium]MBP9206799.1 MarR family transcriptional regulator [Kofleriaceae bacterium]
MPKQARRDLRSLLHVPQATLQVELEARLARLGFPSLRPAHTQLLAMIATTSAGADARDGRDGRDGMRLPELVAALGLPKQTVGDLVDDLENERLVERVPDPDHGVIKRVQLGSKGRQWAAEVKKVTQSAELRWASRLGRSKMRSLRALLEELAATVEAPPGSSQRSSRRR